MIRPPRLTGIISMQRTNSVIFNGISTVSPEFTYHDVAALCSGVTSGPVLSITNTPLVLVVIFAFHALSTADHDSTHR